MNLLLYIQQTGNFYQTCGNENRVLIKDLMADLS